MGWLKGTADADMEAPSNRLLLKYWENINWIDWLNTPWQPSTFGKRNKLQKQAKVLRPKKKKKKNEMS